MKNTKAFETPKITRIDREHLPNAVNIHARRQPRGVHLHTSNVVYNQKRSPTVVDLTTVRQKLEVSLDNAGQEIRFRDAPTEAHFCRAGGWRHSSTHRASGRRSKVGSRFQTGPKSLG